MLYSSEIVEVIHMLMKDLERNEKKNNLYDNESKKKDTFIAMVLKHHSLHGRHDLVWRKKITPYRILVSEIMLQQTQVARVTEKFTEWMKLYPTLTKLSQSTLKDVLILWQGLGYQRRAKALYTIAQTTTKLPITFDGLIKLPGVGAYTASAVCAFAYDTFTHPVIETNIRTAIIDYFFSNDEKIDDKDISEILQKLHVNRKVQIAGARNWYYALMDYGAFLKSSGVSHNAKSKHHHVQSKFKGSLREVRAKVLFAIAHDEPLPDEPRTDTVIAQLLAEGFIENANTSTTGYSIR